MLNTPPFLTGCILHLAFTTHLRAKNIFPSFLIAMYGVTYTLVSCILPNYLSVLIKELDCVRCMNAFHVTSVDKLSNQTCILELILCLKLLKEYCML